MLTGPNIDQLIRRPPAGTNYVNMSHPLARNIEAAYLFNEGAGVPQCSILRSAISAPARIGTPVWANILGTPTLQFNASTDGFNTGRWKNQNGARFYTGTIAWVAYTTDGANSGNRKFHWAQGYGAPDFGAQWYTDNNLYIGWTAAGADQRIVTAQSGVTSAKVPIHYVFTWSADSTNGTSELYINGQPVYLNGPKAIVNNISEYMY